jgi:hypothetical protein
MGQQDAEVRLVSISITVGIARAITAGAVPIGQEDAQVHLIDTLVAIQVTGDFQGIR